MKKLKVVSIVSVFALLVVVMSYTNTIAQSKMVTKSSVSEVTSNACFASNSGSASYEFNPNTNKTLTGCIYHYTASRRVADIVPSKKYSDDYTGSFSAVATDSYKVHLSAGYKYGTVTTP